MNAFHNYSLSTKTDELKKLIAENPDYPIVVLAGTSASDGDHSWTFCASISFSVTEILNCDFLDYDDTVFSDRDRLEEYITDIAADEHPDLSDDDFNALIKEKLQKLEPYWEKVIAIYADN